MPVIPEKADLKKYVGVGTWDQNRQVLRDALASIQDHLNRVYGASAAMVTDADGVPGTSATVSATELGYLDGVTAAIQGQLNAEATARGTADTAEATARANADALLAPLASPAFTGNPTVPTAAVGDADTTAASTAFVNAALLTDKTTDQTPTLLNSWANYDTSTYFGAKFWKDALGYVHLAGRIKDGTVSSSPWTMGVGFIPSRAVTVPLIGFDGTNVVPTYVNITSAGVVQIFNNSVAAGNWVSLEGVVYRPT